MTLSDKHLPEGAHRIAAVEASVGRGYIAETSDDVIYLNLVDPKRGPYTVVMHPGLAACISIAITEMVTKLTTLTYLEENGDTNE